MKKHAQLLLLVLIICVFFFLSLLSALRESLTYDEIVDLQEGRNAVLYHTFDIDPYNPPLTRELGVLPYVFTKDFYTDPLYAQNHPLPGRIVMVLLGVGLIVSVYFFTKNLLGSQEALFASILLALEPTLLAHSHYITMDIGVTLLFFISFFLYLSLLKKYSFWKNVFFAVSVALGVTAKITFIPFFVLTTVVLFFIKRRPLLRVSKKGVLGIFTFCLVLVAVIWSIYFFNTHTIIKERRDASRVSEKLLTFAHEHHNQMLANAVIFAKTQPVPLGDFLATLKNNALRGMQKEGCFFFGSFYSSCRFYFTPVVLFLKMPLSLWILFGFGIYTLLFKLRQKNSFWILTLPIMSILLMASTLKLQPLVRYTLPLYPFFIIVAAGSLQMWQRTILGKLFFASLIFLYVMGTLSVFPHFISYAQEFAGDPNERYKLLMDSNLDWGQSLPDVATYITEKNIETLRLSYFGRADGTEYGLKSNKKYGSYKEEDICAFHTIKGKGRMQSTIISVSNWYYCGYHAMKQYKYPKGIWSDSFLIF